MIDEKTFFDWIFGGVMALIVSGLGFITKRQVSRLDEVQNKLSAHILESEKRFAKNDEMQHRFDKIDTKLDVIMEKLSGAHK